MEIIEVFQVLGIAQTKDERAIKNAYREKLAVTNPEDNPEGFKRLRAAYEEACRYAKQTDEDAEEEQDVTPAGQWLQRVAAVYSKIDSRCDVKQWKALFDEDIFLSLEEEENCRLLLIRFLMDHYKLPTDVWKLLDEKLHIVEDAPRLKESFPADFLSYIANKCERGEDVEFGQFEGEPDAPYDLFLQYYDRCWQALGEEQYEQAAEYIKNADELKIFHPVIEVCRAMLWCKQDKVEDAIGLMLGLKERFPKDAMVCYNTAEILWKYDRKTEAAAVYEGLKESIKKHYMANVRLTEWYYECGRYKEAKSCAEEVLSAGADDSFMEILGKVNHELEKEMEEHYRQEKDWRTGLDLCWCYLQDGRTNQGIRLAVSIEKQIPPEKQAEYNGLLSKLYVEGAEYEASAYMAEVWEKSLYEKLEQDDEEEAKKDKDRIRQSHVIRMQCYRSLGYADKKYFEKAIEEAEGMETGGSKDIGLLLEKAQIYMEMEEYDKCLEITQRLVEDYQIYAAYATSMEVYRRQWDAQGVVQCGRQCIHYFPNYVRAYELVAKVYLDLKYTEDLEALLKEAGTNNIESVILDAYRYQMRTKPPTTDTLDQKLASFRRDFLEHIENGELVYYEKGLPLITEYLHWYPGTYMLVERGIYHKAAHHLEEAKEDFEKALAENPAQPYALNGLSFVYKFQGEYDKALVCLKKAMLYLGEEKSPSMYTDLGNLYSLLGDYERALASYQLYEQAPGKKYRYHLRNLATCLGRCGKVEEAIAVLKKAYGDSDKFDMYSDMVKIYQLNGYPDKSQALIEEWAKEVLGEVNIWKMLMPKKRAENKKTVDTREYYSSLAWQELMFGSNEKALMHFDKLVKAAESLENPEGHICDAMFASILCGDARRTKQLGDKLKEFLRKEQFAGCSRYTNMEKTHLQMEILAAWCTESDEVIQALFDRESKCELCHHCVFAICKEMESIRILFMLRQGKVDEALARVQRNLERQQDEFMMAIQRVNGDKKL